MCTKIKNLVHSRLFKLRLSIFKRLSSTSLIRLEKVICISFVYNFYAFGFIVICGLYQFSGLKRCNIDANANKSNAHQCVSVSVKKSLQT